MAFVLFILCVLCASRQRELRKRYPDCSEDKMPPWEALEEVVCFAGAIICFLAFVYIVGDRM